MTLTRDNSLTLLFVYNYLSLKKYLCFQYTIFLKFSFSFHLLQINYREKISCKMALRENEYMRNYTQFMMHKNKYTRKITRKAHCTKINMREY